jgi:excisionase family DNA binding protein
MPSRPSSKRSKSQAPVTVASSTLRPLTVSRKDAAALLGVDIQTIDGLISSGKLRASRPVNRVLIRVADIEAMLDASAVAA